MASSRHRIVLALATLVLVTVVIWMWWGSDPRKPPEPDRRADVETETGTGTSGNHPGVPVSRFGARPHVRVTSSRTGNVLPVADCTVTVWGESGPMEPSIELGAFFFPRDLPPGKFGVRVAAVGHRGVIGSVRLASDARGEVARFPLEPLVSIRGTVTDMADRPIGGACLVLCQTTRRGISQLHPSILNAVAEVERERLRLAASEGVVTAADGRFEIVGVPATPRLGLIVTHKYFTKTVHRLEDPVPGVDHEETIRLEGERGIAGIVARPAEAVRPMRVTVLRPVGSSGTVSEGNGCTVSPDSDGSFLIGDLTPGPKRVTVTKQTRDGIQLAYRVATVDVGIVDLGVIEPAGGGVTVSVVVDPPELVNEIKDLRGDLSVRSRVKGDRGAWMMSHGAIPLPCKAFHIDGVGGGLLHVGVSVKSHDYPEYVFRAVNYDGAPRPGDNIELTLRGRRLHEGAIRLRVANAPGGPEGYGFLATLSGDIRHVWRALPSVKEEWAPISDIAPGDYVAHMVVGGQCASQTVSVGKGNSVASVVLDTWRGAVRISGRVTSNGGGRKSVELSGSNEPDGFRTLHTVTCDADGHYVLHVPDPAGLLLRARVTGAGWCKRRPAVNGRMDFVIE